MRRKSRTGSGNPMQEIAMCLNAKGGGDEDGR